MTLFAESQVTDPKAAEMLGDLSLPITLHPLECMAKLDLWLGNILQTANRYLFYDLQIAYLLIRRECFTI